jgi:CDP-4-dehydro-6-deoxyglucose reductase
MVSGDDLLRIYPEIELESDVGLERVAKIKEEAFGTRLREHLLPGKEILAQRLFEQSRELADLRAHLQRYHAMVVALRERLREQEGQAADGAPAAAWMNQLSGGRAMR